MLETLNPLCVFSHPNHELAVFGFVSRYRPRLVFLTDGGGPDRLAETREGLSRAGVLDRAVFLDHTEESFYRALLGRNVDFFRFVADSVRGEIDLRAPDAVFCDSVEYYNPVHDISLPLVTAALGERAETPVNLVPLVYEEPGEGERYVCQRAAATEADRRLVLELEDGEVDAKFAARDEVYSLLRAQMGPLLTGFTREEAAREEFVRSAGVPATPPPDRILRYERRGRLLQERGEIDEVITHDDWVAVVEGLLSS